jgi:hypothetical protein
MLQLDSLTMNAVAEVPVPNLLTLNKHDRVWDLLLHQEALVAWQFTCPRNSERFHHVHSCGHDLRFKTSQLAAIFHFVGYS